jgi:hypothetical protein
MIDKRKIFMHLLPEELDLPDALLPAHIFVMDEPGPGGANHVYQIHHPSIGFPDTEIAFQRGPIKENGVNGLTHEMLLAIIIDRLESFQNGPFPSRYNRMALQHAHLALAHLQNRTRDRIARGVEGETKA